MVCKVCQDMLYGHKGRRDSGSLPLNFWHHDTAENVKASAEEAECYLCRIIFDKLENSGVKLPPEGAKSRFLSASLERFPRWSGVYRLDFKLEESKVAVASFVLKQNDVSLPDSIQASPTVPNTSDPKVFELARKWVEDCASNHAKCGLSDSKWHPTRLIDLRPITGANKSNQRVRLVSQKENERMADQPPFEGKYVTLSHRWGSRDFTKLRRHNLSDFQTAILLKDLPLTFQHAIEFASELGVRWIWIDALCILQGDDKDWLSESSHMDKVYAHSYCNISATAAMDSSKGLFNSRDQSRKWFDHVSLRTQDLTRDSQMFVDCTISDLSFWAEYVEDAPVNRRSWVFQERLLAPRVVHWCKDQIAFECRELDRAECRPEGLPHLQMKAGQLIDQARLKGLDREVGRRLREQRLASLFPFTRGLTLMVEAIEPRLHLYEVWKRIVEVYTKMELTDERDRLIALSGIARMMTSILEVDGTNDQYLAGMWQKYLASQLLWYVNDEEATAAQPLENTRPKNYRAPSFSWASVETPRGITFPETTDQGILIEIQVVRLTYRTEDDMFGLLTDGYLVLKGVLRKIELTDAEQKPELVVAWRNSIARWNIADKLSILTTISCLLVLLKVLAVNGMVFWQESPIVTTILVASGIPGLLYFVTKRLHHAEPSRPDVKQPENRYSWKLTKNGVPDGASQSIVYLDSPASEPSIFGPNGNVYCLPASQDDRYLNCLLVQATDGDHGVRYKRVGLTKILNLFEDDVETIKEPPGNKTTALGRYYWGPNPRFRGESHICII